MTRGSPLPKPAPAARPTQGPAPRIRFFMRCVATDPCGYYITDWGKAVPMDLLASTAAEAKDKARGVLGEPPEGRRWTVMIDRITEEVAEQ